MLDIELVLCRSDNYAVIVHDKNENITAIVDAPEDEAIHAVLERHGWAATHIFITHHHEDHVAGLEKLCKRYEPVVIAPAHEFLQNKRARYRVQEGDVLDIGGHRVEVLDTPGHTAGHVSYYWPDDKLLFAGDTLFSLGCGRALECEPPVLWESLKKLRNLPDDTQLYCGHEYTQANARFALSVDSDNPALLTREAEVRCKRAAGKPTLPAVLGVEKQANPFLRADDPLLSAKMCRSGCSPEKLFTHLRQAKDNF
jgi:hydroxyacylglutathione hydrolase